MVFQTILKLFILHLILQIGACDENSTYLCDLWKSNSSQTKYVKNGFTLLILSYKRPLSAALQMFKDMPFLHKILIVKNSNITTLNDMILKDLGVPVDVVYAPKNSMNNRYIPYKQITTKAVLSLDDDFNHLTHEIVLGTYFIWKDHPDSIVGLIERSHELSKNTWKYVTIPTSRKRYSFVLAGAMFIHKKYYRKYSNIMSPEIRHMVDFYKNCDDLAINFIVASESRQPPWLVVHPKFPRLNFGSQRGALSRRPGHYIAREKCINAFIKVLFVLIFALNNVDLFQIFRKDPLVYNSLKASYNLDKCNVLYSNYR